MTYRVFEAHSAESMSDLVNGLESEGWKTVGGIGVVPNISFSLGAVKELGNTVHLTLTESKFELMFFQALEKS